MALDELDDWTIEDVRDWLIQENFSKYTKIICDDHLVDGKCLPMLYERDLKEMGMNVFGDLKRLSQRIEELRKETTQWNVRLNHSNASFCCEEMYEENDRRHNSPVCAQPSIFKPEMFKAIIAFLYLFLSCFVTSVTMVIAHDRVPNGTDYPPLPDIILENVPYISWAFEGAEFCAIILFTIWALVLLLHKHRFIVLRRQCALGGTIFLLRSVTMLITTLSIPGTHMHSDCASSRPQPDAWSKISRGFYIWSGFGMQLQGVRTCGDYMFSGHTVVLTLLAYSITECKFFSL